LRQTHIRRCRINRLALFLFIGLGSGRLLTGQEPGPIPPDYLAPDTVLAVHVKGIMLPNGQMWYEIDPGPIATRAVRVYSMPSCTRVAMVVDPEYRKSPQGQEFMASLVDDAVNEVTLAVGSLPDAHPRFQVTAPPSSDTWIEVWVNGNFFGVEEDRVVSKQLLMGEANFGSAVYLRANGMVERCCECGSLPDVCQECGNHFYNCCVYYQYCEIHCPPQICGPGLSPNRIPEKLGVEDQK
jgi:hypothetical protein